MSEEAQTQILFSAPAWSPTTMAAVKHLPARPTTASGLLWKRRLINNPAGGSMAVNRQALLTSRLYRQERLEALNLRRSSTTMLPRATPRQRPSLTSTANTTSVTTTHSGSSGKKSGSVCDSGGQSVVACTALGPQSVDSAESDCVVLTEEELERRQNAEKCMTWVQSLPAKFSSMHIVQQTVFADET